MFTARGYFLAEIYIVKALTVEGIASLAFCPLRTRLLYVSGRFTQVCLLLVSRMQH